MGLFKDASAMRLIKRLNSVLRSHKPISENDWEGEYAEGRWKYLSTVPELAHYSIIIGYLNYFKPGGAILDVGCGEGILFERMAADSYSSYRGIDISENAISIANRKKNEKAHFSRIPCQDYRTEEKFDAIVFNEVLYFIEHPLQVLKHFEQFRKQDGILIVSMFCTPMTHVLWGEFDSSYKILDEVKITNKKGTSWICKVYTKDS